jgi:hypothetical protein
MATQNNTTEAFDPFGLNVSTSSQPLLDSQSASETSSFDPFGVAPFGDFPEDAVLTSREPREPPVVSRVTRTKPSATVALPPKIIVKLNIHEEISSVAQTVGKSPGASQVALEGSIQAQVQCSDALKNAPFNLIARSARMGTIPLRPNPEYMTPLPDFSDKYVVHIPKHDIGFVPLASYQVANVVEHMPLLLERKVSFSGSFCRIAVQVRSKLSNRSNLKEFKVVVAIPECIDVSSVKILRGNGDFNELQRTISWSLDELEKGESFMVCAQAQLWDAPGEETVAAFPVLLRCKSSDQISDLLLNLESAEGYPSSVTLNTNYSFRLLHRLP